ncbi:MAG: hypothetical protein LBT25_03135, partial [Candidatus Symbiothrix sp.]|nr:hypothetical protein [Candidatus Symbiothrix sp.]
MKNVVLTFCFLVVFIFSTETVSARGAIVYSTGPHFETKQKLPIEETVEGAHVNFGVAYEQFSIFWIPIWNYGETEYALITDDGETAYYLEEESLEYFKEEYDIDTSSEPSISFWNKIGGKLIWIVVILLVIWGSVNKKK